MTEKPYLIFIMSVCFRVSKSISSRAVGGSIDWSDSLPIVMRLRARDEQISLQNQKAVSHSFETCI